jgi:hypothetical protein
MDPFLTAVKMQLSREVLDFDQQIALDIPEPSK